MEDTWANMGGDASIKANLCKMCLLLRELAGQGSMTGECGVSVFLAGFE